MTPYQAIIDTQKMFAAAGVSARQACNAFRKLGAAFRALNAEIGASRFTRWCRHQQRELNRATLHEKLRASGRRRRRMLR